jgi:hypothetical protein
VTRAAARVAGAPVAALALAVALAASACGGDDGDETSGEAPAADASLDVAVEPVDAGVRISWTVTNDGEGPLLVFDNLRGDEAADEPLQGAYVTGGDGGVVEVSRRLFPVPDDLEGVQDYTVTAGDLGARGRETRTDSVTVPFTYAPAAPEGGGDELPEDVDRAVFCLGVAPPGAIEGAHPLGPGRWAVPHSEANAAGPPLLCSDPFDV